MIIFQAINSALEYFAKSGFGLGFWIYAFKHPVDAWKLFKFRKVFDDLIQSMINKKMRDPDAAGQQNDFLSLMLSATDQDSKYHMSFEEIHDEIITFLFGGFETGAGTLCWFLYHMGKHLRIVKHSCPYILETTNATAAYKVAWGGSGVLPYNHTY